MSKFKQKLINYKEKIINFFQKFCGDDISSENKLNKTIKDMTKDLFLAMPIEDTTEENTEWFSLNGVLTRAKVICVYDDYSLNMIIPFEDNNYKFKCILSGLSGLNQIDPTEGTTENDETNARQRRVFLKNLITDKIVWVKCVDWNEYGRLLVTVFKTSEDVNNSNSINGLIFQKDFSYKNGDKKDFGEWYEVESHNKKEKDYILP